MEPAKEVYTDGRRLPEIATQIVYAEDHPEYVPLAVVKLPDGAVAIRWVMSGAERRLVAETGEVYLIVHTFNHPLQPLLMMADPPGIAERDGEFFFYSPMANEGGEETAKFGASVLESPDGVMTDAEKEALTERAVIALAERRWPFRFDLDMEPTVCLIAQLQLAFRVQKNTGRSRRLMEGFVREMIEMIDPGHGDIYKFLMMGFDSAYDMEVEGKSGNDGVLGGESSSA